MLRARARELDARARELDARARALDPRTFSDETWAALDAVLTHFDDDHADADADADVSYVVPHVAAALMLATLLSCYVPRAHALVLAPGSKRASAALLARVLTYLPDDSRSLTRSHTAEAVRCTHVTGLVSTLTLLSKATLRGATADVVLCTETTSERSLYELVLPLVSVRGVTFITIASSMPFSAASANVVPSLATLTLRDTN